MQKLMLCLTLCPEKIVWGQDFWRGKARTHLCNTDIKLKASDTYLIYQRKKKCVCIYIYGVSS
jgi:hypothetical protein